VSFFLPDRYRHLLTLLDRSRTYAFSSASCHKKHRTHLTIRADMKVSDLERTINDFPFISRVMRCFLDFGTAQAMSSLEPC